MVKNVNNLWSQEPNFDPKQKEKINYTSDEDEEL